MMTPRFPQALTPVLNTLATQCRREDVQALSALYHQDPRPALPAHLVPAYMLTRFPATWAVCHTVLQHPCLADLKPQRLVDIGAGPGTAVLAWLATQQEPSHVDLYDRHLHFKEMAMQGLSATSAQYHTGMPSTPLDVLLCSYVLNEVSKSALEAFLTPLITLTCQAAILIEPGTPLGYARLMQARELFIAAGFTCVAPCPHQRPCPLPTGNWCHFSQRLSRTHDHRLLKEATLGYEDEKYTYLILKRGSFPEEGPRVITKPRLRPGHVLLDLCTPDGLAHPTLTKAQGPLYKRARHLAWGDVFTPTPEDRDVNP